MAEEISPLEDHDWWMERLRKDTKTNRPKPLRLADSLATGFGDCGAEIAAELRRLVAENERLHQINQSHEMKLSVRGYEIQIADLKTVNQELLGALNKLVDHIDFIPTDPYYRNETKELMDAARAAIAKAEEQK
jgi:DNA polymerase/3'-5' exonuclease PolX